MKLSHAPFRWFSAVLLVVVATAMAMVAGSTLWRVRGPSPPVPGPDPSGPAERDLRQRNDRGPRVPQVWVIAIGIDQYQDEAIPACRGAVRDARAVGEWFTKTAGWDEANVLFMDDLGRREPGAADDRIDHLLPTRANLNWAFRLWLGARVRPDDQVVVFYAGQAVPLPPPADAPEGHPGRPFLLPIDAVLSDCERTGWQLDEAIDPWAASGRNPVVCWLDTSLQGRGRSPLPVVSADAEPVPGTAVASILPSLVRWPGVTAWVAAEGRPAAEATAVGALSPFTSALLDALGTPERPANLQASLAALLHDAPLAGQGFRALGGIDPNLTLWSSRARRIGLARRELLLQRGHAAGIAALAFTADGDRMITGSQDSTIKVWSATERSVLQAHASHLVGVTCLDVSPDGRWLVSGDGSGRLRVGDLVRDRDVPTGPTHARGVDVVAFLPEGDRFVSVDLDGACLLSRTADPAAQVRPLSKQATGLAVSRRRGRIALALAETDGKVRLLDADGNDLATLDGPGATVTSRRLAVDGRRLAAADDARHVILWDAADDRVVFRATMDAPIDALALAPADWLAVAAGREVALISTDPEAAGVRARVALADPANLVAFSNDGRWLAASTSTGGLNLWTVGEAGRAEPIQLESVESTGRTTTLAFTPDGRKLVSGDQDGGVRTWNLPDGHQRPKVPARRGQVAALSVSDDGRYLLQITQDRQAQVWDLQEGRGLLRIAGEWTSGAMAPDGRSLYLTPPDEGDIIAVDRASGRRLPLNFDRPGGPGGAGDSTPPFARVTIARDGRWVAAASAEGPLARVWDTATGKLAETIRGHLDPHPISALSFSAAADRLLTASEDGTAKLWDLSDIEQPARALATYTMKDATTAEPLPITAAALAPDGPRRVVTGGIDGQVQLWQEGIAKPIDLGHMDYSVLAATFTPDGKWLAATGADKTIWLWDMTSAPRRIRLEPMPHHDERINALAAWPGGKLLASGSDDTTIRLWDLEGKTLLGTLSAEQGTTDWVAYTPDGLFDSSIGGEQQVTWRDDRGKLSLEQVYDQFHVYKLTDQLRRGIRPQPPERPRREPPRLAIDQPPAPVQVDRLASLTISSSEPGLTNLRLYQDGVPVQTGDDFQPTPGRQRFRARVHLHHGLNRFHVMAGRPGSIDVEGRSEVVEIRCDASDPPGRVHVLALGVSEYNPKARALQFADRDARQLADFLQQHGVRATGTPGLKIVLTNREVTGARIDDAFVRLRDQVKQRPGDTVVVFLAGHADVIDDRFVLLLSSFPFGTTPAGMRTGPTPGPIDPETVLPYVALYRNIARLGALKRLVVIDACQAEAINDDPGVRMIQEQIDGGSRRARTAYLLAARRGEPAGEVSALEHGLMTYALLKGLGESDLESVAQLDVFSTLPNADQNHDRVVTTEELRRFVDATVPALATRFPTLVQRAGVDGPIAAIRPAANLDQNPRIQASDASFSLITLPGESEGVRGSGDGGPGQGP